MPTAAELLCTDCKINSLPRKERVEVCAKLALYSVHQWWSGNPTYDLSDVSYDIRRCSDEIFSNSEVLAVEDCMAEHSSTRCEALNNITPGI